MFSNTNDIYLIVMIYHLMSLHFKLVPVYTENTNMFHCTPRELALSIRCLMSILFMPIDQGKVRPHVYIATENVTFVVDERVDLVCYIEKKEVSIDAKWIREETKQTLEAAFFSSHANTKDYHQFHYEIKKVSTKDNGIYKCVANFFGYGPVEAWYNLQVKGKKKWLISPLRRSLLSPFCKMPSQGGYLQLMKKDYVTNSLRQLIVD